MSVTKISQLPGLTTVASGTTFLVVDSGTNYNTSASNVATYSKSAIFNSTYGTDRSTQGSYVFSSPTWNLGGSIVGATQGRIVNFGYSTTGATATVATADGSAASTTNQIMLSNKNAVAFCIYVVASVTTAGGNTKAWKLEGLIKRNSTASGTAIVGSVTKTILGADTGASTWDVAATADTTNGALAITVTGQSSTTINWNFNAHLSEVGF
jgi:hypothetical protein